VSIGINEAGLVVGWQMAFQVQLMKTQKNVFKETKKDTSF